MATKKKINQVKDYKKWDKVRAQKFNTRNFGCITKYICSIEKVTIVDVIKTRPIWSMKKKVIAYTVQNEFDEVYSSERKHLYSRRNNAFSGLYGYVKWLLWNNLKDFIDKHK